jgi:hypothetical protein
MFDASGPHRARGTGHLAENAVRLRLLEPRGQDVAQDPGEPRGDIAVAAGPTSRSRRMSMAPALAHELQRLREPEYIP